MIYDIKLFTSTVFGIKPFLCLYGGGPTTSSEITEEWSYIGTVFNCWFLGFGKKLF